jgi:hypothetical protein
MAPRILILKVSVIPSGEQRRSEQRSVNPVKPPEVYASLRAKRYWVFSALIFLLMVARTLTGFWLGDFWMHAAVVRELATHPFSPLHPQLLIAAPHAYSSPYLLGVALVSRLMNLDPITALALAGLANLVLFLAAFRWFIVSFFDNEREAISFYALLFVLVLWGKDPWFWSAFFHISVLGFVLPYPSTFASACMFVSFGLYLSHLRGGGTGSYLLLIPVMSVIFLSHPPTAIVTCIALTSFSLGFPGRFSVRNIITLFAAFALSFCLAAAWPYYSFIGLLMAQAPDFHGDSRMLYQQVLNRIFPALVGIPLLALRLRKNILDPLAVTFLGLTAVYCYGYVSHRWGYGRVISHMVMMLQIALAAFAPRIESRVRARTVVVLSYAGMLVIAVVFMLNVRAYKGDDYRKYAFLSSSTKQYDLVLSDLETSWYIPSFGGKVIAHPFPVYFVPDYAERKRDLLLFFSERTTDDERRAIIRKYRPDYLLLRKALSGTSPALYNSLARFGTVVYSDGNFLLLSLKEYQGALSPPGRVK